MKLRLEELRSTIAAELNNASYLQLLQQFPLGQFINISDTPLVQNTGLPAKVVYVGRRVPLQHQPVTLEVVFRAAVAAVECYSGGLHFATLLVAPRHYRVRARHNHCSLSSRRGALDQPKLLQQQTGNGLHYWVTSNRLLCVYQSVAVEP